MVEFVNDDIVIKIRSGFFSEFLRIEGLNRNEKIINILRLVGADKHLAEVRILQNRTECIKALLQYFLTMRNKEQSAGSGRILLAESLVIKSRYNRFACACCGNNKVAIISSDLSFRIQLIKNLLLIRIRSDVHCVNPGIVGVKILFRLQSPCKALLLLLVIVFKLI